jgi:hypothetical protein
MPDVAEQLALAEEAAKKAEAAAGRAAQTVKGTKYMMVGGFAFALVGAVLAFALAESDPSVLGVRLQPFGGVLFAVGVLLIAAAAFSSMGGGGGATDSNSIKTVGGLIAVVAGITAVGVLTVVTLTQLGPDEHDSMVAVTSSAFGIISAVVGAYLGIKITADTADKASEQAKGAAVARHEADVKEQKISTVNETLKKLVAEDKVSKAGADAITEASVEAEEEARAPHPPLGGGA